MFFHGPTGLRAYGPASLEETFIYIKYKHGMNTPFSIHKGLSHVLGGLAFLTGLRAYGPAGLEEKIISY
jgi:hypothetical protein